MHPKGARKCRHCGEFFVPDVRSRRRQRYCTKVSCRKASKAASSRRWRSKPENADYFRGEWNAARVREWQARNPGYWKRGELAPGVLQDLLVSKAPGSQALVSQDERQLLQHIFASQDPVLVGLISHLAGTVLQDSLLEIVRRLRQRGTVLLYSAAAASTAKLDRARPSSTQTARG